ncbi:MAG: A/G-specific adenine glycosylase [Chloroflexota bacterium]|nr:A/G-specific adenine glycosylase [Chloroflexota bacterium]
MAAATLAGVADRQRNSQALKRIRSTLLGWYLREHRDFPWRNTRDPYAVLVSEVMLQQTQASRAADRFPRFLERFPTAAALAAAPQAEVLAAWTGLGYNRRAMALQRAAQAIVDHGWPPDVAELERLPGIGPYTARAVASLAFSQPVGVVDTNVRRWLVRRFGADPKGGADLQKLADALAAAGNGTPDETAAWTHATMEFGARVCAARSARCDICPIAGGCPSRGIADRVPVTRQARFVGSSRARRGALLRMLAIAEGNRLPAEVTRLQMSLDRKAFGALLDGLERDGLLHRSGARLCLGGAPTIGQ